MKSFFKPKEFSLRHRIYKNRQNYILMSPFLIVYFLFTLLPIFIAVFYSFTSYNMLTPPKFVGWENYARMILEDEIFLTAFKNTMVFALITGPISYILCFIMAWLINDLSRITRTVITVVYYAPVLSGQAYTIWRFFFSADSYGIINGTLMKFGIILEPIGWLSDPKYILTVLIVVQIWMSLGTGFLSFIAGLQGLDRSLIEAGLIDGISNRVQELWYIVLPGMKPQLQFGAVMQIISAFSVSDISINLLGYPSTQYAGETIVTHITDVANNRYELGYACALATVLFVLMFLTNKLVSFILSRVGR